MQEVLRNNAEFDGQTTLEANKEGVLEIATALAVWASAAVAGQLLAYNLGVSQLVDEDMHRTFAMAGFALCSLALPCAFIMRKKCNRAIALTISGLFIIAVVILANMT